MDEGKTQQMKEELAGEIANMGARSTVNSLHEMIVRFGTPDDFKRAKDALKPIVQEILARL